MLLQARNTEAVCCVHYCILNTFIIDIICFTFPSDGAVALDDPEYLLQLVAVGEQVKETLSVAGTVAQVDGDIGGRDTALAIGSQEPVIRKGTSLKRTIYIYW